MIYLATFAVAFALIVLAAVYLAVHELHGQRHQATLDALDAYKRNLIEQGAVQLALLKVVGAERDRLLNIILAERNPQALRAVAMTDEAAAKQARVGTFADEYQRLVEQDLRAAQQQPTEFEDSDGRAIMPVGLGG